ncbi:hypothetical protein [Pelagibius sp.]|uniref:hypothetical protein n=1 Tax=Pelagibius sp. TaxID=1931238 RepID=UPI003B505242
MSLRALFLGCLFSLASATALLSSPQQAHAVRCEAQINAALEKMSVPQSDVKSVKVTRRSKGAKSASNYTYDAWVRLNSCSGYFMVQMTRYCYVMDSYTSGDCDFSGMTNY